MLNKSSIQRTEKTNILRILTWWCGWKVYLPCSKMAKRKKSTNLGLAVLMGYFICTLYFLKGHWNKNNWIFIQREKAHVGKISVQ